MEKEQNYEIIEGTVRDKERGVSTHPKAPIGVVFLEGDGTRKFTVWKKDKFDAILKGSNVRIMFEEKDSIVGDKEYKNYNVIRIQDVSIKIDPEKIDFTDEEKEILSEVMNEDDVNKHKSGEGFNGVTILGHKLVIKPLEDIEVPQGVYDYLISKGFTDA